MTHRIRLTDALTPGERQSGRCVMNAMPALPTSSQHAKMKTILIVEDEPSIVTAWKSVLQVEGYLVLTASNGHQALFSANGRKPDLIITDRSMPITGGVELFRHLKLGSEFSRIPVILTSSVHLDHSDAGVGDGFLFKPVPMDMLLAAVRRLLDAH
ncbi:response regulator [Paraburkholderia sp. RL17-337-BIB-A]|uniref:response regulator n=1 Tax=Paraburkholderia sp. RL17-337-BIB-A TaxID=3031636 RepID=UPI0038B8B8FA